MILILISLHNFTRDSKFPETPLLETNPLQSTPTFDYLIFKFTGISMLLRQDYLVNKVVETKKNQAFFVVVKVSPYRILTTNIATSECNIHGNNLSITDTIVM